MIRVVVVDDEFATKNFLCSKIPLLNGECAVVGSAADGREALEILAEAGADLVITDIKMPVMDGLELCREVRDRYPGVFTVILSGYGEFDFARQAIQNGVFGYLLKPVVNDQLKALLDTVADKIRLQSEQRSRQLKNEELVTRTTAWLVTSFLRSAALGSAAEIASCGKLLEDLDIRMGDGPFAYLQFSPAVRFFASAGKNRPDPGRLRKELLDAASDVARSFSGYAFDDASGNVILLIPTGEEKHFCRTAELVYQKAASRLGPEFGEIKAAAAFLESIGKLAGAYETAGSLVLYDGRQPIACFIPEMYFYPEPDCVLVTEKEFQTLSELRKCARTVRMTVASGDSLAVATAVSELFALTDRGVRHKSLGERLYNTGMMASLFFEDSHAGQWLDEMKALSDRCDHIFAARWEDMPEELAGAFIKLLRRLEDRKPEDRRSNSRIVESVKDIILKNYNQPMSLTGIADQIGVSANYLSDVFSRETGETYLRYLTKVRMRIAAHYIESKPSMSINEIAEKTGYVNSKHFLHVFKKSFGMTPSEYKNKI